MRQLIPLFLSILIFLLSCEKSKQTETTIKQDSSYLYNLAVIKALGNVIKHYAPVDTDTLTSEKEISLDNESYKLKLVKYCLNDSAVANEVIHHDKTRSREFNMTHNYVENIILSKGKEIIFNKQFSKYSFKENLEEYFFRISSLYDVQYNFEKADKLYFTATLINPDTNWVEEVKFGVYHKTEKVGQLDFPKPEVESLLDHDLNIYDLMTYGRDPKEEVGFISLSDNYPLSEHPDSLAIPDLSAIQYEYERNAENGEIRKPFNYEYFKLDSSYRERFLMKLKISETDKVFIYHYHNDILLSIPVKDLDVIACLNIYDQGGENTLAGQGAYMFGFGIDQKTFKSFGDEYYKTFVYVGDENPFIQGQIKPIVWKKIKPDDFPTFEMSTSYILGLRNLKKLEAYKGEIGNFQFYIQDFSGQNSQGIDHRQLLVVNSDTKEIISNRFLALGEGSTPSPLNFVNGEKFTYQFAGELFKNKPPVFFGFEWHSFGCQGITVLDTPVKYIPIYCDNRH